MRIWSFFLLLEQAQAALYDAALRSGALDAELSRYAGVVAPQERDHVDLLRRNLGSEAQQAPAFDHRDATSSAAKFR